MNLLKIVKSYASSWLNPSNPFFAHYFVTTNCNLTCPYCGVWRWGKGAADDTTLSKKIIHKLSDMGVGQLSFTGGEPLIRSDFSELVSYARGLGLWTQVTSNGTMPSEAYARLAKSGIDFVSVSFDSFDFMNNKSGVDSSQSLNAIHILKENGVRPNISCTITDETCDVETVKRMLEFAQSEKVNIMLCPAVIKRGEGIEYAFRVRGSEYHYDKVKSVYDFIEHNYSRYPLMNTQSFLRLSRAYMVGDYDRICEAGKRFIDVLPDGGFGFCQDFWSGRNILDDDFDAWWRSGRLTAAREKQIICEGCVYGCYPNVEDYFNLNLLDVVEVITRRVIS